MYLNEIYRHARDDPETFAIVVNGSAKTYREFAAFIHAVRTFLMDAQVPRGGVVATLASNPYLDWVLLLALRSLGITTISANNWSLMEELRVRDLAAFVCFAAQSDALAEVARKRPDLPVVAIPLPLKTDLASGQSPELINGGQFGDHILFSSGTTGIYKKVRYDGQITERCVADPLTGTTARLMSRHDIYHGTSLGPWTKAGYIHPLICWLRGAAVIFDQRPDWAAHFFDLPVTMSTLMPPYLKQLSDQFQALPSGHPKLTLLTGGGFVGADLVAKVIRQFRCEFHVIYGSTEMRIALESQVRGNDDVVWLRPNHEPDVEICDKAGQSVSVGEEGILRIRLSPNYPTEYMDDPAASARHFRNGYFYPGDLAVRRSDGRIRIVGRVDDVLNIGGVKLAVAPLEQQTRKLLRVDELCLFMQQNDNGSETLIVAIEGSRLPDRALLQSVARLFGAVPQISIQLIEKFPRSDNGMMKVKRREVLNLALEAIARAQAPAPQPSQELAGSP
jgi:acyl-coenzyme A synthetase/AMP-(fatty) acid ligase